MKKFVLIICIAFTVCACSQQHYCPAYGYKKTLGKYYAPNKGRIK